MIGRECFFDTTLLHDNKASTVDQTPVFVSSLLQELPCVFIQGCIDIHEFDVGRGPDSINNRDYPRAWKSQRAVKQGDKFSDDIVGRDDFLSLLTKAVVAPGSSFMLWLVLIY